MRMPTKITKPTATQNSGSARKCMSQILALQRVVDRGGDRRGVWCSADQPLHDRACGLDRDAAHVAHRGRLRRGDLFLGLGELGVELRLMRLAAFFGLGVEL